MQKITYFELLGMIRNKNQPKKIYVGKRDFLWDEDLSSYVAGSGYITFLNSYLTSNFTDVQMVETKCIEI